MAHLSDLHLGRRGAAAVCRELVDRVLAAEIDHVAVSGDVTDHGSAEELALFDEMFAPLAARGRLTAVPGNHDRAGSGEAMRIARGRRVWVERAGGAHVVCLDTTAPHNRSVITSHGALAPSQIEQAALGFAGAPASTLRVLLMHHHPLPLPDESLGEWLATRLGRPYALELRRGRDLVERVSDRCELVLYGHKHVPRFEAFRGTYGSLHLANGGSSTELGAFVVYEHHEGRLTGAHLVSLGGSRRAHERHRAQLAIAA